MAGHSLWRSLRDATEKHTDRRRSRRRAPVTELIFAGSGFAAEHGRGSWAATLRGAPAARADARRHLADNENTRLSAAGNRAQRLRSAAAGIFYARVRA